MSQISLSEANDLLSKLLKEKIPVHVASVSSEGMTANLTGFVDSICNENGVTISASGPPIVVSRGYVTFRPHDVPCIITYGEQREMPHEVRQKLTRKYEESCLVFTFSLGWVGLFFTV